LLTQRGGGHYLDPHAWYRKRLDTENRTIRPRYRERLEPFFIESACIRYIREVAQNLHDIRSRATCSNNGSLKVR
jgi:hypothetical protein